MLDGNLYNILLLFIWIILCFYSLFITKNIFSPPVMFSGILGLFYADLFYKNQQLELIAIYISMLCVVVIGTYPYIKNFRLNSYNTRDYQINFTNYIPAVRIWILAVPAILCQLYFIYMFGGLTNFLIAAKFGTKEFYGLGPLKTIISSIYPLGLIFFCYYINSTLEVRRKFLISLIIFQLMVIIFAILTLSRGTLLNYFLIMMICWSILVKKISTTFILVALVFTLVMASFYGVIRETFTIDRGEFSLGLENKRENIKTEWAEFGTFPLKKVLQPNGNEISYGMTYLTIFTNFIPRVIWPNKPEPGGVIFTRDYSPGLYDEYNQYTTGLIPEAIINFGIVLGIFFGLIQLFSLIYIASTVSIKLKVYKIFLNNKTKIYFTVGYAYFLWSAPFFLTGEFTNISIGLLIKIIFIYMYYMALTKRITL